MSIDQINYNVYNEEFNPFFSLENSNEYGYQFMGDQTNELFEKLANVGPIGHVKINPNIPDNIYTGIQTNGPIKQDLGTTSIDDEYEINSVEGEKAYDYKTKTHKNSHDTTSTAGYETSSLKSPTKTFENFFTLVEDKNKYEIGKGDDYLTPNNNSDLLTLDKILSNNSTDMNVFIGDMLKCCPCDTLVKKQRIYKAKNIKRKRKTRSQLKTLEKEFKNNPNWDKDDITRLSKTLNLTRDQVYKWFWDTKKKCEM